MTPDSLSAMAALLAFETARWLGELLGPTLPEGRAKLVVVATENMTWHDGMFYLDHEERTMLSDGRIRDVEPFAESVEQLAKIYAKANTFLDMSVTTVSPFLGIAQIAATDEKIGISCRVSIEPHHHRLLYTLSVCGGE